MRICFLHAGFSIHGGIERVLSIVVRHLSKKSNVDLYCLSLNKAEPLELYKLPSNVKFDYMFDEPVNMKRALLNGAVSKVVKYLKINQIDAIIACGVIYYPLACIGGKLANVKTICWEHTNPASRNSFMFEGVSRRVGACFSNLNILISQEAKEYYCKHYRKKNNIVIYNPVDDILYKNEKNYRSDARKLISVGRLTYEKNYQLLLNIAEKILFNCDGWTWHIYGDGEQKEELESLIVEKGLSECVFLMGNVADIYDRYHNYAAIVMTSRNEGFPMVLLEAAAKGLPMISFDISTGPKEIINDGVNGFLIPNGDVDCMIEKLSILMNDNEMRMEFSVEAKKCASKFCVDNIANQWYKLLMQLIK